MTLIGKVYLSMDKLDEISIGDVLVLVQDAYLARTNNVDTIHVEKGQILICVEEGIHMFQDKEHKLRILLHSVYGIVQIAYDGPLSVSPWKETFRLIGENHV